MELVLATLTACINLIVAVINLMVAIKQSQKKKDSRCAKRKS